MNHQTIQKFHVIGISTRTTNANGQAAMDLEKLWTEYWTVKKNVIIPDQISDDIYAIYTDYESDYTGFYTTIIGVPASSLDNIPEGFVGITIETDVYKKFVSKGKMPDAVFNTWLEIWGDEKLNKERAYRADFTIHGQKYYDGDNAEVETFLSIKL